jgi:hypothetical protein
LHHVLDHLDALDTAPAASTVPLHTLCERLAKPLNSAPIDATQVIDELAAAQVLSSWASCFARYCARVAGALSTTSRCPSSALTNRGLTPPRLRPSLDASSSLVRLGYRRQSLVHTRTCCARV